MKYFMGLLRNLWNWMLEDDFGDIKTEINIPLIIIILIKKGLLNLFHFWVFHIFQAHYQKLKTVKYQKYVIYFKSLFFYSSLSYLLLLSVMDIVSGKPIQKIWRRDNKKIYSNHLWIFVLHILLRVFNCILCGLKINYCQVTTLH